MARTGIRAIAAIVQVTVTFTTKRRLTTALRFPRNSLDRGMSGTSHLEKFARNAFQKPLSFLLHELIHLRWQLGHFLFVSFRFLR